MYVLRESDDTRGPGEQLAADLLYPPWCQAVKHVDDLLSKYWMMPGRMSADRCSCLYTRSNYLERSRSSGCYLKSAN